MPSAAAHRLALLAFVVVWAGLAFVLEGYTIYRFTIAAVYAIAILGINLLTGLSGQLSIGHSAFYAIGAYTMALAMRDYGISAYATLPLAGITAFVAGFLFGWPALRLSLVHLALATWGLALALPQFLKWRVLEGWTGGVQGLYVDRPGVPEGVPLSEDQWWHLVVLAVLVPLFVAARNLRDSRTGRALIALRDNEIAAAPSGINVPLYKTLIFGVSAGCTGIAGALGALLTDFVGPDSYGTFFSILLLVGAVAGGLQSIWGALFGGLLIQFLPDLARGASGVLAFPAYGFILIGLVYLMPHGFAGAVSALARRLAGKPPPPSARRH